ncbi:hypothetical protein CDL15_Pgr012005 [Punica granatum]|uniref:Uncharacterized protein n=1 Tax=Punica granatum TaxID=22663 RepID=A0A218Y308_PUNGR|nr:hypothetical protein CDL15_Pgr012005 [Punica granatum]
MVKVKAVGKMVKGQKNNTGIVAVVSTSFWLTFLNNDISNGPDYDLSRNTENGSAEQEITIHPQVGKIEQMTHAYDRRTPRVIKEQQSD